MEKNLTDGSVFKNLAFFSLPYLLSYFLQTLYGMADLFIIGSFDGTAATTSVSVGSQVMHMLTVIIVGLAMGSTVSIGNAVGAGDRKKAAIYRQHRYAFYGAFFGSYGGFGACCKAYCKRCFHPRGGGGRRR